MDAPVIEVENLRKTYGATTAVADVSLTVARGEVLGVLGPNGAGKTTTVECLAGLRAPDAGRVSVLGLDPQRETAQLREALGMQLQESELPGRMRVDEAMALYASFYDSPADADELLTDLGLADKRSTQFRRLSGGQKQRLSVALALVGNPQVAVLDELTTGLDPQARRDTWSVIERIRDRGVTIVLVTHFLEEAERLCDRVVVIDRGRVVAEGTPAALAGSGGQTLRFRTSVPLPDGVLRVVPGVDEVRSDGLAHVVRTRGDHAVDAVLALTHAGVRPEQLEISHGSLEDAFVRLVTATEEDR
ncbi:ABC transporter ATP-binding protein [Cellulomonas sp. APG4]|uniref:ABC transporter ATP-binding protein n=1 Tax=Cellulomonas sp. APG4 TaxID=1538656 RepID=UPI00137AAA81|nr:ABC transporter ATP-binding protein [Cellulomonas sp. APG4]NCT91303.1 ABC transporter ATP-binding protein [Cellulomonas sp. APG4]